MLFHIIANAWWSGLPHERLLAISQKADLRHLSFYAVVRRGKRIKKPATILKTRQLRAIKYFQKVQRKTYDE